MKALLTSMNTLDLESTPGDKLSLGGEMMKIAEVSERYAISSDTLLWTDWTDSVSQL